MTFINQKEEVLDVQLTSHGKELLGKGKFNPVYYSFSDDDVLYDASYARNTSEDQKDIFARITQTTPRMKLPQSSCGVESNLKDDNKSTLINQSFSSGMLSNSEIGKKYTPSLDLRVVKGDINIVDLNCTGSFNGTSVPRLKMEDREYIVRTSNNGVGDYIFNDKSSIVVEDDYIYFTLGEENGSGDGFEVSFFEIENETINGVVHEKLNPMQFIQKPILIKNNILLDESEIIDTNNIRETKDDIEYYFDIQIDNEIGDPLRIPPTDIYTSTVTEEDVEDVC